MDLKLYIDLSFYIDYKYDLWLYFCFGKFDSICDLDIGSLLSNVWLSYIQSNPFNVTSKELLNLCDINWSWH